MTKILVIDSINRQVRPFVVNSYKDMQQIVGGIIERAVTLTTRDDIFVDEEGMFKAYRYGFVIKGAHQPFIGNGFVIGEANCEGNPTDVKIKSNELLDLIQWIDTP